MTSSFLLLSLALALLTVAWLTRPLWWRPRATTDAAALPSSTALVAVLGTFVIVFVAAGYAMVGSPHRLALGPASIMPPQGGTGKGQDAAIIERMLRFDLNDPRALRPKGETAGEREDCAAAVAFWERLQQPGVQDRPAAGQVEPDFALARELACQPGTASVATLP